ncbi:ATPase with role in protein import into the ER, partial [Entomortierella beljakovae]
TGFLAIEVEINNVKKLVTPEEIAAVLFKEIKEWSKTIFTSKEDLLSAIVAIPYHYDDRQRDAIKNAATIAGLNIKLITRTSKAALNAYRIQGGDEPIYIVYHLGGNTLAATLFDCDIGVVEILEEIETRLGGSDFDQRVVDYFVEKYKETHGGNDISKNPLVLDKLRRQ